MFKNKTRLGNNFITSCVAYKCQCGLYNESYYGEGARHLKVRIGEKVAKPAALNVCFVG